MVLKVNGQFTLSYLKRISEVGGYEPEIRKSYRDKVTSLTGVAPRRAGTEKGPIQALLERREEYVDLVREFVDRLRTEAATGTA